MGVGVAVRACAWRLALAALGLAAPLAADPGLVGTTSGDFLKLGAGARAVALGEAVTADPQGLSDQAYNPAGLSLGGDGVELTHTEWFEGAKLEGASARLGLGAFGGLGLTYAYLGLPSQQQTVTTGNSPDPAANYKVLGTFTPADMAATLGYGVDLGRGIQLGGDVKATDESLIGAPVSALGGDLGLLVRSPLPGGAAVTFGLAALNLGPFYASQAGRGAWPQSTNAGLAYSLPTAAGLRGSLTLDYDMESDAQAAIGVGIEAHLGDVFTPRFGYRLDGIFNPWSVGLGVQAFGGLGLDLAMVPAGDLGTTYRASLAYRWGAVPEPPAASDQARPLSAAAQIKLVLEQATLAPSVGAGSGRLRAVLPAGTRAQAWGLYIYDVKSVMRSLQGKGLPPSEIVWDGKHADGSPAEPGAYPARLALKLDDGTVRYSDGYVSFSVLQDLPSLSLKWGRQSSVGKGGKAKLVPTVLDVKASGADPALAWRVQVIAPDGSVFRTLSGDLSPSVQVLWDGKGDQGQDFYSNYRYQFKLALVDRLGNQLGSQDSLEARMVFGR